MGSKSMCSGKNVNC